VLFEELLWALTGGMMRFFSRFAPIAAIEDRVRRLPPLLALPLFILPWLIMLPVKIGAVWLIAMGKVIKGTVLFIGGEAFGAAFLARLYELCRPALHRWRWFVMVEGILLRWTQWAHDIFFSLPLTRSVRRWMTESRDRAKKRNKEGEQGAGRK
jgi:hypothetical protein